MAAIKAGVEYINMDVATDVRLPKLEDVLRIYQAASAACDEPLRIAAAAVLEAFLMTEVRIGSDPPAIEPYQIWHFSVAQKELQQLSTNGGDEDWVAVIPPSETDGDPLWMNQGSYFGCCSVDEYDHPSKPGYKVKIGCHA